MSYAIEINKLSKTYQKKSSFFKDSPKKVALNSIDLKIKKGCFFGLLGPNGAGKSTIINILAGLVKKTSGQIKICNIDIDQNQKASKFKTYESFVILSLWIPRFRTLMQNMCSQV